jgi:hypothetical protein
MFTAVYGLHVPCSELFLLEIMKDVVLTAVAFRKLPAVLCSKRSKLYLCNLAQNLGHGIESCGHLPWILYIFGKTVLV